MDKEDEVQIYHGILPSHKKDEMVPFAAPGIELESPVSLALQADSLPTEPSGKPHKRILLSHKKVQNNAIWSNMGGPRGSHTE